jgi:hypothetical protein
VIIVIMFAEEYKLWSCSMTQFPPISRHCIPLRNKYYLRVTCIKLTTKVIILSLCQQTSSLQLMNWFRLNFVPGIHNLLILAGRIQFWSIRRRLPTSHEAQHKETLSFSSFYKRGNSDWKTEQRNSNKLNNSLHMKMEIIWALTQIDFRSSYRLPSFLSWFTPPLKAIKIQSSTSPLHITSLEMQDG